MRKVVIVGPAYPLRGGLATYDERLCRGFSAQGWEASILTFKLQYPEIFFPGKTQYSTEPPPEQLKIDVSLNSIDPFNWIKTGNEYARKQPDLVVFRYWMPFMAPCFGTLARRIKSNGHTRTVAITDNIFPHEPKFYDRAFTRYFLAGMDGFVTMSKKVLEDLKEFDLHKPRFYNPHPMYDSFGPALERAEAIQKLGLDPECRYLLFFGFIRAYKGLDTLLRSFARMNRKKWKVKLIIAGEFYEDETPYRDLIRELELEEDLVFKNDFIPDSKVPLWFSAADMVVQTYKSATQSGVTQIAYFYDKPMLVTNVGGLAELVPDGKVGYVTSHNPLEIASKLEDFYENQRYSEFVPHILEEKQQFRWEEMIHKLELAAQLNTL